MDNLTNYCIKHFGENLEDISKYGCQAGFNGLIYYRETDKIFNQFSDVIWDLINVQSEEYGYKNSADFIADLNGADFISDELTKNNLLVWFAVEYIARTLVNDDGSLINKLEEYKSYTYNPETKKNDINYYHRIIE